MTAIVSIQNATKDYHLGKVVVPALRGVSLDVSQGEFLSIAGPSGSGKTTLLNLIGCVDTATTGTVEVAGKDTAKLSERDLTRLRLNTIGFIFQSFNLVGVLDVYRNIELPLLLQNTLSASERSKRVLGLLDRVGLLEHAKHRPNELSGGQRQRVAIARAFLMDPRVLILDDATASVDSKTERLIQEAMKRLCEGRTTFIIAQRLSTLQHADCIIVLQEGRVVASGKHEQLASENELYRSLFNQNSGMEIR